MSNAWQPRMLAIVQTELDAGGAAVQYQNRVIHRKSPTRLQAIGQEDYLWLTVDC
jgi:hypothetical protein